MPTSLNPAGHAKAFPFEELLACSEPRGQDTLFAHQARSVCAATERTPVFANIQLNGGVCWILQVSHSQRPRGYRYPFE